MACDLPPHPPTRAEQLPRLPAEIFDVLIVGGGINGAVTAAALSARGIKVALAEAGDFAGKTSSSTSCLIWGGIKYLQNREFRLVRSLCKSRNRLMEAYPSAVREMRFLAALDRDAPHRPTPIYLGAWLYWLIGSRATKTPRLFSVGKLGEAEPAIQLGDMRGAVSYSDAFLPDSDARFVFNFIARTWRNGGCAINYLRVLDGTYQDKLHHTTVEDAVTGFTTTVRSRAVINACGPWTDPFNKSRGIKTRHHIVFSKGIHLVVPRVTTCNRVLSFFSYDGRPFFVFPLGDRSCVGTTDTRVAQPETEVNDDDRTTVLSNINRYLGKTLSPSDIIAERCGVRPLVVQEEPRRGVDWTELSRKHVIETDNDRRFLTIFGGKLTDCLNVGEEVVEAFGEFGIPGHEPREPWFGEPPADERDAFLAAAEKSPEPIDAARLWRRYGASAWHLLERLEANPAEAHEMFEGTGLLAAEVHYAARAEMVLSLSDFLRRRTLIEMERGLAALRDTPALGNVAQILFPDHAYQALQAYVDRGAPAPAEP
ncbi:MAG: glycerol-3-phosphate dehydrogenase/oxidase [Akkermansiaceae bacterium]|nr:glycerol-3-phosphate dehydrogenase/oxidase [Akkermansiaceae bacterium]